VKKKSLIWVTGIVVAALVIWGWGLFRTVKDVVEAHPELTAESRDQVFPAPEHTVYQMNLKLDPVSHELWGYSLVSSTNTTNGDLDEIWLTTYPNAMREQAASPAPATAYYSGFDPGYLEISQAKVNNRPVVYSYQGISTRLQLDTPIYKNDVFTIEMEWKVKIPRASYRLGGKDGVILLGNFYPQLNVKDARGWHIPENIKFGDPFFSQVADYAVAIQIPEAYQLATSGEIVAIEAEDTGWQRILIRAGQVRDFALAAALHYQTVETYVNGIEVEGFFRGNDPEIDAGVLERTAAALKYYGAVYGSYSGSKFVVVQGPMQGFQGMEYSGMIFLSDEVFKPSFGEERRAFLVAHEVAHQWWYHMVGNDQLNEPWLDEGLASWSARQYLKRVELDVGNKSPGNSANLGKSLQEMGNKGHYYDVAYSGGEAFWAQLEEEQGEEKILAILRHYLAEFKHKTASTEDLRRIIEEECRSPLDSFFDFWF